MWFCETFGEQAPICPLTDLMWLDLPLASNFYRWYANSGATSVQLTSARSALNYLLNYHHSMAFVGVPGTPQVGNKLSIKDATIQTAMHKGILALKTKRQRKVTTHEVPSQALEENAEDFEAEEGDAPSSSSIKRQSDPLRGKVRTCIPEVNLERMMLWFTLTRVTHGATTPSRIDRSAAGHYMRAQ